MPDPFGPRKRLQPSPTDSPGFVSAPKHIRQSKGHSNLGIPQLSHGRERPRRPADGHPRATSSHRRTNMKTLVLAIVCAGLMSAQNPSTETETTKKTEITNDGKDVKTDTTTKDSVTDANGKTTTDTTKTSTQAKKHRGKVKAKTTTSKSTSTTTTPQQ